MSSSPEQDTSQETQCETGPPGFGKQLGFAIIGGMCGAMFGTVLVIIGAVLYVPIAIVFDPGHFRGGGPRNPNLNFMNPILIVLFGVPIGGLLGALIGGILGVVFVYRARPREL
jgi:hypothetical protein